MPPHSRIWIYQSEREFLPKETEAIRIKAIDFVSQWTSHDQLMKASIEVFYDRFVVVCVDEKTAPASGCGIDKSVKFIQALESELNISLLDRNNVAFRTNGKIISCKLPELKTSLTVGEGKGGALVFNNLVATKEEFEKNWEVPIEKSWHKQFVS